MHLNKQPRRFCALALPNRQKNSYYKFKNLGGGNLKNAKAFLAGRAAKEKAALSGDNF